jgi:hypothetical protein
VAEGAVTRLFVALAALAPWAAVLPLHGVPGVLAHALLFLAAAHGAGLVLGGLASRQDLNALVAIQWGFAGLITIGGIALMFGAFTLPMQVTIVCMFAGVHTAVIIARWHDLPSIAAGPWLAPALLLAGLAAIHMLGAAGDIGARPFDDDGHVLAQLQRLRDTGALEDGIGYARRAQLGGQLVLTALATVPGDVHLARLLEAIAFAAALGHSLARIRPRDLASSLWAVLIVITGCALAFVPLDLATCWTAVGLLLALHAASDRENRANVGIAGLLAGALIALRLELAPLALAGLVRAWWPARRMQGSATFAAFGLFAVVLPYAISRWSQSPPSEIRSLLAGGAFGYVSKLVWPLAITAGLIIAVAIARRSTLAAGGMIASIACMVLIHEGRESGGRQRWTRRYLELAANIEYVRHSGMAAPVTGGYAALLAGVPRDATVALWVTRPERLDYGAHRFVDLRTPRVAPLRVHRWDAHVSKLEKILVAAGAEYLLLEVDDRTNERVLGGSLYRFMCVPYAPACADDLEVLALQHPIVAAGDGLRLIKLRTPR